jgi:hypothetical protein
MGGRREGRQRLAGADVTVIDMRPPHLDGFGDPVATLVMGAGAAACRPRAGRPAESFDISRRRVGVPRRQGRAKIIPDGGAAEAGSLAAPRTSRSIAAGSLAGTGGRCWRRAVADCSVNLVGGVIRAGRST